MAFESDREAAVGASIPLLIVFFFLQSYIVKGLAEGAVKS